jgi:hypothetical protein
MGYFISNSSSTCLLLTKFYSAGSVDQGIFLKWIPFWNKVLKGNFRNRGYMRDPLALTDNDCISSSSF